MSWNVFSHGPGTVSSVNTISRVPQLSVPIISMPIVGGSGMDSQGTVSSPGTPVSVGGTVSCTVIICKQVATLPQSSVADQVRSTVKVLGQAPGMMLSTKSIVGAGPHSSVAVGVPVSFGSVDSSQFTVISGGQVISGRVVSRTVICAVHWINLPQVSCMVKVIGLLLLRSQESVGSVPSKSLDAVVPYSQLGVTVFSIAINIESIQELTTVSASVPQSTMISLGQLTA